MNKRIDIEKKINQDGLTTSTDFIDKLSSFIDSIYFILICSASIFSGIMIVLKFSVDGELAIFLIYILSPLLLVFGIYGLYRIWSNTKFIKVTTGATKFINREIILDFLKYRKYQIVKQTDNSILVIEEESTSFDDLWTEHIWFVIVEDNILFNIQKHYPLINPPVFFSHLLLKQDLKAFIKKK